MVDYLTVDDVTQGKVDDVVLAKRYGRLGTIVGEWAKTLTSTASKDHG